MATAAVMIAASSVRCRVGAMVTGTAHPESRVPVRHKEGRQGSAGKVLPKSLNPRTAGGGR